VLNELLQGSFDESTTHFCWAAPIYPAFCKLLQETDRLGS